MMPWPTALYCPLACKPGRMPLLQLGKIGRRRASTCLLAVVLDTEGGDDAPALAALLRVLPKVCLCPLPLLPSRCMRG